MTKKESEAEKDRQCLLWALEDAARSGLKPPEEFIQYVDETTPDNFYQAMKADEVTLYHWVHWLYAASAASDDMSYADWADQLCRVRRVRYIVGITDPDWRVRAAWASRPDMKPTREQALRGFTDEHWWVRKTFAERLDVPVTDELIELGRNDPHAAVRLVWQKRCGVPEKPQGILKRIKAKFKLAPYTASDVPDLFKLWCAGQL